MNNATMDQLDQAHEQGVVLGLRDVAGVAQRLDIDVMFMEQPETFNLFLIALMEIQGLEVPWQNAIPDGYSFKPNGKKMDMKMSWFDLAGIHGYPKDSWDNEGSGRQYCTHWEPTFASWHRPYLALMEKKGYLAAAKQFRLPFWDYFRPRGYKTVFPGVINPDNGTTSAPYNWRAPQIFTLPQVMVRRLPDNDLVPMPNPLFHFRFTSENTKRFGPKPTGLMALGETIRYGGSDKTATDAMNSLLKSMREDDLRQCLAMIEDGIYSNSRAIASDAVVSEPNKRRWDGPSGSIEDFHGTYHGHIGGGGHISSIGVTAFDPIFWMHHCQIDRLFAIWQAANGEQHWFNELHPTQQKMGEDPLLPFRHWPLVDKTDARGRFWTSERARQTTTFGYTYPDTDGGNSGDKVRHDFATKYEWSRRASAEEPFGTPPDEMKPLQVGEAQVFQYTSGVPSQELFQHPGFPVHKMQKQPAAKFVSTMAATTARPLFKEDWYIDIMVERMLANGSFTIYYIIGAVQGQTGAEWSALPGLAGVSHILASPQEDCANCERQAARRQLVISTTPITSLLFDYKKIGRLASMNAEDVKAFLVENLKWRVQTVAGEVLNPRDMAEGNNFTLNISRKRVPVSGGVEDVNYDTFPEVIEEIIRNSS